MRTVFPTGTTLYDPDRCAGGYTLFPATVDGRPGAELVDTNGTVVKAWTFDAGDVVGGTPRAKLLPDGHVVVLRTHQRENTMTGRGGLQEYDWEGNLVREYSPPPGYLGPHHDFFRTEDGNTLLLCYESVPAARRREASDPRRREELYGDAVLEVTPEGEIVWEWHAHEHLDVDRCNDVIASRDWWAGPNNNTITDWTHANTIRALPENDWHDGGDDRFAPGNVMVCFRQLDLVVILDRATGEVVWEYTGDYRGGLSGQHEAHMIPPGLPGAGNVLLFDNGASPTEDLAHAGCSFVLEVCPTTKRVEWVYEDGEQFHSNFTSSCQRLPGGTTLVVEAAGRRIFEVTREGEVVWEYVHESGSANRAYRYPYDYCPGTDRLETPPETPVTPPEGMRVER